MIEVEDTYQKWMGNFTKDNPDMDLIPDFYVKVEGVDVTDGISKRTCSITVVDNRGFEADTLELKIDDADGLVDLPRRGAKISIMLGYKSTGCTYMGDYLVDGIEHSGAPDMLSISAKSADFNSKFVEKKSKAHHATTIGKVIEAIAAEHKLKPLVSKIFRDRKIQDKQQADESDANFITRLAQENDAIATVKAGMLLFLVAGDAITASGNPLPVIEIFRRKGDQHRYSVNDRDAYTGVKAQYNLVKRGKRKEVIVGDDDRLSTIRTTFKSEEEARNAAEAELKRLKRGAASFSFYLAIGNPELTAESPVVVYGFKKEIDAIEWLATKVTHKLDASSGLTTQVECEKKTPPEPKKPTKKEKPKPIEPDLPGSV